MKRCMLVMTALMMFINCFSQTDTLPAYKRFPTFPPVKLILTDSVLHSVKDELPKKKAVMFMMFNPSCEHCQHEIEEITANIDKFKDIQIVMATTASVIEMRSFIDTYHLADYKNIIVGQDSQFFLPVFFMMHNLPYLAMYDKKGQLIDTMQGSRHIDDIMKVFE